MRQVFLGRVLVKSVRGVFLQDIMDVKLIDFFVRYVNQPPKTVIISFHFCCKSLLVQSKFLNFVFTFHKIKKEINKGNPAPALIIILTVNHRKYEKTT